MLHYCTHCKRSGHTQHKCYKLHGFPPGYKTQNYHNDNRVNATCYVDKSMMNQNVQEFPSSNSANDVITGLTHDQCQQIIAMLSGQLAFASVNVVISHTVHSGNHYIFTLNSGCFQSNVWILDSGATRHVCNNLELFANIKEISNTRIRLPNQSLIQVNKMGDIKVNSQLVLKEVLFVP